MAIFSKPALLRNTVCFPAVGGVRAKVLDPAAPAMDVDLTLSLQRVSGLSLV